MPRGSTYPNRLAVEARELSAAGWTTWQIRALFLRRGLEHVPSRTTIDCWTDEDAAERHRRQQRQRQARQAAENANFRPSGSSSVYQDAYARWLVCDVGLTRRAASLLLAALYGPDWTEHKVKVTLAGLETAA